MTILVNLCLFKTCAKAPLPPLSLAKVYSPLAGSRLYPFEDGPLAKIIILN